MAGIFPAIFLTVSAALDSNFKQPTLRRPYSLRPRVSRRLISSPSKSRGDGAPSGASIPYVRTPLPVCGASRRSIAASYYAPGRAFHQGPPDPGSASSSQGTLVSPGGAPTPPGCGGTFVPARGRRIRSHLRNVLRRRPSVDRTDIILVIIGLLSRGPFPLVPAKAGTQGGKDGLARSPGFPLSRE
jgi:hypothetical protein